MSPNRFRARPPATRHIDTCRYLHISASREPSPRSPAAASRLRIAAPGLGLLLAALAAPLGAQDTAGVQGPDGARAPAADSALVRGTVRAESGAPVAGATVSGGAGPAALTGPDGRFALPVAPGSVALVIRAVGFRTDTVALPSLRPGETREVAVSLVRLTVLSEITVRPEPGRPLLDTLVAATGGAVDSLELRALPADGRDPLALAFTVPGVAQATGFFDTAAPLSITGSNSLYTQYDLDGLDNTEAVLGGPWVELPLSALAGLEVMSTTYGADRGRTTNGVVEFVSRSGGDRWHGELFGYGRPGGGLDSDRPFGPTPAGVSGFRRLQLGGAAGGPIRRGRTHTFGAAEYTRESEGQTIATGYGAAEGEQARRFLRLFGRVDQRWGPRQLTTVEAAYTGREFQGRGGGIVVPEADFTQHKNGALVALTHRSAIGEAAENRLGFALGFFHWYYPPTESSLAVPQVNIVAASGLPLATVGSSGFQYDHTERQLNLRDVVERRWRRHTAQAGVDVLHGWFTLLGSSTNPAGSYTVIDSGGAIRPAGPLVSIADVPPDIPVKSYTVDASPQTVRSSQTVIGAFVQDRWDVSSTLRLTLGIRWDYDDLTGRGLSAPDLDNLQPRAAFNWRPDPLTVLRGGAGVYTGKLLYTIWSDALQFSRTGATVVTLFAPNAPPFGRAPTPAQLAAARDTLPPREVREPFPRGLQSPTSYQLSLGFERRLSASWGVSVDAVHVWTRHLPRLWDLNAVQRPLTPADSLDRPCSGATCPGDRFRPNPPVPGGVRQDLTTDTGGRSTYWGLYTTVRHALSRAWSADLTWVWSRTRNDTEDINFAATQGNDFALEYADAVNDRRHKLTFRTFYTLSGRVRLAAVADYQTGTPINRIAFFRDLDGSGGVGGNAYTGNFDRFYGVPRNGERLPDSFELNASVAYLLPVGRSDLEVRADIFNLLNRTNESGYANGIPGGGPRTQVGRPGDPVVFTSAGRPRQTQVSVTYRF